MKTFTLSQDITMELTTSTAKKFEEYLFYEKQASDATANYHQAIHDVFCGDGEGYDRSDLYDWEEASSEAHEEAWDAWERFCA